MSWFSKSKDPFTPVRKFIQEEMSRNVAPGLSLAVAHNGEIIWEEGFGWADRERELAAAPDILFSLASITKPITTTALMLLKQQGKLDLDSPIDEYLFPAAVTARVGNAQDATVRRVANHTAGLPLHFQFFYADEPYLRPPMQTTIQRYANLITASGERYQYSNLGYGLLDYIIEQISGKSYTDFLREEVFEPLGMERASVDIAPGLQPYAAARYGADGVPYPHYDFDHPGGSAVYCSAHDLVRFGMFHLKERLRDSVSILNEDLIDEMQQPGETINGPSGYGLGWAIQEDPRGFHSVHHSGGMGGARTILYLVPERRIAIAVLCNAEVELPIQVRDRFLDVLLSQGKHESAEPLPEAASKEETTSTEPASYGSPEQLQGEWEGYIETYKDNMPLILNFEPSGEVHARLDWQAPATVEEFKFENNYVSGFIIGDIDTDDANRYPYRLHLDLKLRGDLLNGAVIAQTYLDGPCGGAPGRRMGSALSYWTELVRVI